MINGYKTRQGPKLLAIDGSLAKFAHVGVGVYYVIERTSYLEDLQDVEARVEEGENRKGLYS